MDCRLSELHETKVRAENCPRHKPYIGHLMDVLSPTGFENLRILDLGCGPQCYDLHSLESLGASLCVGIDMVGVMSKPDEGSHTMLVRADIDDFDLPVSDCSFNLILMHNVVEHLHNPLGVLEECKRVLKPGGLLSLITENHAALKNRMRLVLGGSVNFPLWRFVGPEDHVVKSGRSVFTGHVREYTTTELRYLVSRVGLDVVSTKLHPAASKSGRDISKLSGSRADSITRLSGSRLLFSTYHLAELAVPSWRYMVTLIAKKK